MVCHFIILTIQVSTIGCYRRMEETSSGADEHVSEVEQVAEVVQDKPEPEELRLYPIS